MITSLTALILIIVAVAGSTAMVGIIAYLLHRIGRVEAGPNGDARLLEQIDAQRLELAELQDEVASLTERLDFTERLLAKGEDDVD